MKQILDAFVKYEEGKGYIPFSHLRFDFPNRITWIPYYNHPYMAISLYGDHKYFLPFEFPYYLVRYKGNFYGAIYQDIQKEIAINLIWQEQK